MKLINVSIIDENNEKYNEMLTKKEIEILKEEKMKIDTLENLLEEKENNLKNIRNKQEHLITKFKGVEVQNNSLVSELRGIINDLEKKVGTQALEKKTIEEKNKTKQNVVDDLEGKLSTKEDQ